MRLTGGPLTRHLPFPAKAGISLDSKLFTASLASGTSAGHSV